MKTQINKTIFHIVLSVLLSVALFLPLQALSETIAYVSDELSIAMRSGMTNSHRIIKFLASGTRLVVLEKNEDGSYTKVSTADGKEGWVETDKLMNQLSARDRLVSANKRLDKYKETIKILEKNISELKANNTNLSKQLASSEKQVAKLDDDLANLKKVSANPIALANKNRVLEENLTITTNQNEQLKDKIENLSDKSTKEWFILGAAVSLGSLLFGLLITRIRWQKKRGWGDF